MKMKNMGSLTAFNNFEGIHGYPICHTLYNYIEIVKYCASFGFEFASCNKNNKNNMFTHSFHTQYLFGEC